MPRHAGPMRAAGRNLRSRLSTPPPTAPPRHTLLLWLPSARTFLRRATGLARNPAARFWACARHWRDGLTATARRAVMSRTDAHFGRPETC